MARFTTSIFKNSAPGAATSGKRDKAAVNYRVGGDHCHACRHFYEMNERTEIGKCRLVAGPIGGHNLCNLFDRKSGHEALTARG